MVSQHPQMPQKNDPRAIEEERQEDRRDEKEERREDKRD
jgi:hypothetical protein